MFRQDIVPTIAQFTEIEIGGSVFVLLTGNCGENRTYCTQRLAGVVLARQHFLLGV